MSSSFNGWLNTWSGWGGATDPNDLRGTAAFSISAVASLSAAVTVADMQGASSFSIGALGYLSDAPPAQQPQSYPTNPSVGGGHSYWGKPYKGTFLSPGAVPWTPPVATGRKRRRRDLDILFLTR